ncbi:hypothetical protein BJX64DRAFT_270132 [Aspergillus heterothallicus]
MTITCQIASTILECASRVRNVVHRTPSIADKGLGIQFSEMFVRPLRWLKRVQVAPHIK